jgi:probable O-glycosylation ligase (exosortase A-associated)
MRDIAVSLLVFGSLPFILWRPYIGIMMWAWLSYMNPHRLSWGFAYNMPFAQIVALVTLVGMLGWLAASKELKRIPWAGVTVVWLAFVLWMNVTTFFALTPEAAWVEWERTMKIQFMTLITLVLINSKERLQMLIMVIAGSMAFFGVKGGIFTVLTGGSHLIWGPPGSFIEGNNEMALALIMTLPLLRYIQTTLSNRWMKYGLTGAMLLCGMSILGSHSRGALVAGAGMVMMLWWNSRHKGRIGLLLLAMMPAMIAFMPSHWFERMETISTYEEDGSAMGRINSWWYAVNLARDHPLTGGGFDTFQRDLFPLYAPDPTVFQDAHSIYFEILGEHGFVGLALFLGLGITAFLGAARLKRIGYAHADMAWMGELGAMLQVSLVGYALGGAFLGLAYFDLYYHLIAIIAISLDLYRRNVLAVSSESMMRVGPNPVVHADHRGPGTPVQEDMGRQG